MRKYRKYIATLQFDKLFDTENIITYYKIRIHRMSNPK